MQEVLPLQQKAGRGLRQCSCLSNFYPYDPTVSFSCLQDCNTLVYANTEKTRTSYLKRLLNASSRERNSARKRQAAGAEKVKKLSQNQIDSVC